MKNISDYIGKIAGKRIILRADLDVPILRPTFAKASEGRQGFGGQARQDVHITETFRIERQKEVVSMLRENSAKTLIIAHTGKLESFRPIFGEIKNILGDDLIFIDSPDAITDFLNGEAKIGLLDNLRRWPGEEANDTEFSEVLAKGFDVYVNNAFAVCHRDHASVSGIPKLIPAYAGPLIIEEVKKLSEVLSAPSDGKVIIIGGAKAGTKIPVIKNLINKADRVLVGGVVANDILKARGVNVGLSKVDENIPALLEGLDINDSKLIIPTDWNKEGDMILDIGQEAASAYAGFIKQAKLIIWNGPMGMFEKEFMAGTRAVAQAIADSSAESIIGGGDTMAVLDKLGISLDKFSFVSTGGGAMLAFLAGGALPGLLALDF